MNISFNDLIYSEFLGAELWRWYGLVLFIALSVLILPVCQKLARQFKKFLMKKFSEKSFWAYWCDLKNEKSISFVLWSLIALLLLDILKLPEGFSKYLETGLYIFLAWQIIWVIYLSIDALGLVFRDWAAQTETTLDDQLAPFATKTLKALVLVLGFLITLQNFGINVVSLLAGLGLGGLALALAAQDTAANLFGSITILFDNPFQVGDWIKVAGTEGTVEEIGFRSTRIRTFYNSLVTIPNSTMAKEQIDNMGARPFRRIRHTLGIHYDTSPQKIQEFCDQIKYMLLQDARVDKTNTWVYFVNYNASNLDILVNYHLRVSTFEDEYQQQQIVLLEIKKIADQMGVIFAYPTQSLYVEKLATPPPLARDVRA